MSKSEKTKPSKRNKPLESERWAIVRRILGHGLLAAVLISAFVAGFVHLRRYVETRIVFATEPPTVVLKNRPVWMSDYVAARIAATARPVGTHSSLDPQLLRDADAALRHNPWIAQVNQVRRVYGQKPGDTLEIDCDYRAPVALVQWGSDFWLVDRQGYKLPAQYCDDELPRVVFGKSGRLELRIISGVRLPPPQHAGESWPGDDLRAGIQLIEHLYGLAFTEEIQRVDVSNFAGRINPREAQLVLATRYPSLIKWGEPWSAGEGFHVEIGPEQKLARLEQVWKEYARVDAGQPWIDVRFDRVVIPSVEPARADGRR